MCSGGYRLCYGAKVLWIGVRKGKLTHGVMTFSDVGLELSCMQLAPRASLMLLLVGQPRFSSNRLEMVFLGAPPSPSTPLVLCIADIYLRQMSVTNSDADLLSSVTVHE